MPARSRCSLLQATPLVWIDDVDEEHPSVVALACYVEALQPNDREELVGRIIELRRRAAAGELRPSQSDFVKVARHPAEPLFELKWSHEVDGQVTLIRQYHGEPPDRPKILVALHRHIKSRLGSPEEIYASQDGEIDYAHSRYASRWQIDKPVQ